MNDTNPYQVTPKAELYNETERGTMPVRYAGFWIRFAATIIDSILQALVIMPILWAIYGDQVIMSENIVNGVWDILVSYVLPFLAYLFFWVKFGGTPGKRLLGLKVLDEATGLHVSIGKGILRYLGYILSTIMLLLGFVWVAFDKKKKGVHDHVAGTIVVYD